MGCELHENTCHQCFISTESEQTSLEDSQNIVPPGKWLQRDPIANQMRTSTKPHTLEIPQLNRELPGSQSSRALKDSSQILVRHEPSAFQIQSHDPKL